MEKFDLIIRGGKCVLESGVIEQDLGVKDGKITLIDDISQIQFNKEIDATGKHIFPGIIDTQVHFREPGLTHKEDLASGSRAAVLGGVTTFLEMPNTNPATTTDLAIAEKVRLAKEKSLANFGFFMGGTAENIVELKKVKDLEGCCGIKIFLGSSTGNLLLFEEDKLKEIFSGTSGIIALHSENEEMLVKRKDIRDAATTAHAHAEWRNVETALSSTKRVVGIAKDCGRKVHVLHITSKAEMEFLAENKDHCTIEVTPQHLTLFAPDCYDQLGTYAQMNPPIRTKDNTDGLWKGLRENVVDVIGSDHAPHSKEEKDRGYPNSPSGMPGVQTIFPVLLHHVDQGNLTIEEVAKYLCFNPSKLYGLNKGHLKNGFDADITIVDLKKEVEIKNIDMASKCGWTPFDGMKYHGELNYTIVMGNIVVEHGQVLEGNYGQPVKVNARK
ncbi:dihydroorotase [Halobacteriovorax marinus]|uniref:Dihydroorotase n=1 Tax=Halobacteriovorax marinus TaxID=97084 RepID=A0A1Y5F6P2_9BACT|nr:dihydroorotase [Halobacteriovorax marinus]